MAKLKFFFLTCQLHKWEWNIPVFFRASLLRCHLIVSSSTLVLLCAGLLQVVPEEGGDITKYILVTMVGDKCQAIKRARSAAHRTELGEFCIQFAPVTCTFGWDSLDWIFPSDLAVTRYVLIMSSVLNILYDNVCRNK